MKICFIRKCSNCGKEVEIRHKKRITQKNLFCSKNCESEYRKKQTVLESECPVCHKRFHVRASERKRIKYSCCSRKCMAIDRKIDI